MKQLFKHQANLLITLIVVQAFFACNSGDDAAPRPDAPIQLESRPLSVSDDSWTGGEQVKVHILCNNPAMDATITATAASGGILTPNTPIYWTGAAQTITARAWYPDGWTMTADQSNGYQAADFVFAPAVSIEYADRAIAPLTFSHKTAKVKATLKGTVEGIDDAEVTFYGYTSGTASTADGSIAPNGNADGAITPFKSGGKSHTALLIPYTCTNANFLKVSIDGKDYFWQPASQQFEAGHSYDLQITVKETELSVTVTDNGAEWAPGSESDVTAFLTAIKGIPVSFIPAGLFKMGSSDGTNQGDGNSSGLNTTPKEPNRNSYEKQHWVKLTKDFYMSRHQITNVQYAAFLNDRGIGSNGQGEVANFGNQTLLTTANSKLTYNADHWEVQGDFGEHPVTGVRWFGAKAFADWAGGRLPTEAQWEYACRGGVADKPFGVGTGMRLDNTLGNFNWGSSWSWDGAGQNANEWSSGTYPNSTQAVGLYPANSYGLYDMHGNVYEWCADTWNGTYDGGATPIAPAEDPMNGSYAGDAGSPRVLRGGTWYYYAQYCRSAFRDRSNPVIGSDGIGFRVVWVQ